MSDWTFYCVRIRTTGASQCQRELHECRLSEGRAARAALRGAASLVSSSRAAHKQASRLSREPRPHPHTHTHVSVRRRRVGLLVWGGKNVKLFALRM